MGCLRHIMHVTVETFAYPACQGASNSSLCFSKCARSSSACASDRRTSSLRVEEASLVRPQMGIVVTTLLTCCFSYQRCHFVVQQNALQICVTQVLQRLSEHHCFIRLCFAFTNGHSVSLHVPTYCYTENGKCLSMRCHCTQLVRF